MNLAQIKSILEQNEGHLFDYGKDGFLVLDKEGQRMTHLLPVSEWSSIDEVSKMVRHFFADNGLQENQSGKRPVRRIPQTFIDFDVTILRKPSQVSQLLKAARDIICGSDLVFRIHFQSSPDKWVELLDSFSEQQQGSLAGSKCCLYGPFTNLSDQDMEFLFVRHFSLFFVPESIGISEHIRSVVLRLAEFGFRVPFVWYVDADNVAEIPKIVDEALFVNMNAGFAVPLAEEKFFHSMRNVSPRRNEYTKLLMTLYKQYPYYDDAFYPLNHILAESMTGLGKNPRVFYFDDSDSSLIKSPVCSTVRDTWQFLFRLFLWQRWSVLHACADQQSTDFAVSDS